MLLSALVCGALSTLDAQKAAVPAALLPPGFAGLQLIAPASTQTGPGAADADARHAALLREDGLLATAAGTYAGKDAGPALTVRAWRFADATGAYAAFTAYRQPEMRRETLGVEAAAAGGRYLFWTGATLVDASLAGQPLPHADAQALVALRGLAAALPRLSGPAAVAPPLRGYLPDTGLEAGSVHYAIGPAGYAASGSPLPESVIDFSRDAEVAVARYRTRTGEASLTLIDYPTPQMAAGSQKAIATLINSGAPAFRVGDPANIAERIGPLVAFTTGSITAAEAHGLIRSVHYGETITINHPEGYVSEVSKAAKLLLGIAYFTGIMAVAAVLLALFLGAGRVGLRRLRGKPDSSMNDEDFISLKL